jgi:hypothetical protein
LGFGIWEKQSRISILYLKDRPQSEIRNPKCFPLTGSRFPFDLRRGIHYQLQGLFLRGIGSENDSPKVVE